ncbi:hypothetical protein [Tengunoibacter tsumagoiensis]|uniref:Uncharacterized protein n=1 Tax=Tengunoibacter tsumagoiensis TaxID=2014871 RepID=A0A402A4X0_9CHLR|nr:hypothetical protein [Tengunoibacter tsumagoiensis]GCE14193.1 hypothetical protein KTT_40520 [Tengunoibacter tsumagoiensis]GCE14247.1 hypothetical protein KTT_41060 [Tengunoibacter tsumagoiensis]
MAQKIDALVERVRGLSPELATEIVNELTPITHGLPAPSKEMTRQQVGSIYRNALPPNASDQADISNQTVSLVKNAQADFVRAGTNLATGFIGYDLKAPAAMLIPFLTPLLNMTPRQAGVGVPIHNWKAVVDFFGGNSPLSVLGAVDDGGTPSYVSRTVTALSNTFQTIGLQDALTFQAEWRGRSFEGDLRALLTSQLLYALKLIEENWLINMSDYLWTPPPPLVSTSTTGGSLAATNPYWFAVTAVNTNGETLSTGILGPYTIASGTTGSIALTLFTVPNTTTKYNVYAATAASKPAASAMFLQSAASNFGGASALNQPASQIQGNFSATMTSLTTSGTALSTVVSNTAMVKPSTLSQPLTWQGAQSLVYNNAGIFANIATGTGALKSFITQPAATTGYLALSDIQNQFLQMFNAARANPEYLFCSPQDAITITNLVTAAGNTRVVVSADSASSQNNLIAGYRVTKILNEATGRLVDIVPLPYLAQGTLIFGSMSFPYPVSGYNDPPFRIIYNRDYYGVDYPPTQQNPTAWGFGDFVDETLCNEFLGGWGILNGVVYH